MDPVAAGREGRLGSLEVSSSKGASERLQVASSFVVESVRQS